MVRYFLVISFLLVFTNHAYSDTILTPLVTSEKCTFANFDTTKKKKKRKRKPPTISEKVYERIIESDELLAAGHRQRAKSILIEIIEKQNLTEYEYAFAKFNLLKYLHEDNEINSMINHLSSILKYKNIPQSLTYSTYSNYHKLNFLQKDYEKARSIVLCFDLWLSQQDQSYFHEAQWITRYWATNYALFMERLDLAVIGWQEALDSNLTPYDNYLILLRSIWFEKDNYEAVKRIHRRLVELYPEAEDPSETLAINRLTSETADDDQFQFLQIALVKEMARRQAVKETEIN